MNKKTNVTIISINLNRHIFNEFPGYEIITNNFTLQELKEKKKVIFYKVLDNLDEKILYKLFKYLQENNIKFINMTGNMELVLFTDYLIIFDEEKILMEGQTFEILKKEKLLKRLGFKLPFIVELSTYLKDYGIIDHLYLDEESLVNKLWK